MRKIGTIILLFFYLIPAIGFSINIHRCGNKVKMVAFDSSHEKKCPCNKKMPAGCCKDVQVSVKLTNNHKTTSQLTVPANSFVKQLGAVICISLPVLPSQVKVFDFTKYHAPPFESKQPVYLTNSVFRI